MFYKRYILGMANSGPNTNNSQFFILNNKASWLNNRNVGFGQIIEGHHIAEMINALGTGSGAPLGIVRVEDCGRVYNNDYPDYPMTTEYD